MSTGSVPHGPSSTGKDGSSLHRAISLGDVAETREAFAAKIRDFEVDSKFEEKQFRQSFAKIMEFVRVATGPAWEIPLSATMLAVSSTEWQVLVSEHNVNEDSFRGKSTRYLRPAIALRAAIQEELAFFQARQNGRHLWKQHFCSLLYLADRTCALLPLLVNLVEDADQRGLHEKARHVGEIILTLRNQIEKVSEIEPLAEMQQGKIIHIDPQMEEVRLLEMLNYLVLLAKNHTSPPATLQLHNSVLDLTPIQWQILVSDCPNGESSFRYSLRFVVRRALSFLALMQDESAARIARPKKEARLTPSFFHNAARTIAELEYLRKESAGRKLSAKAEDLMQLEKRLTDSLAGLQKAD